MLKLVKGTLQTLFNTIPEIAWMEKQQLWVFSADQQTYQRVWRFLQQHRAIFEVVGVPLAVLKYLPKTTQLLGAQLQQDYPFQHAGIGNGDILDDLFDDWDFDIGNHNDDKDGGGNNGEGDKKSSADNGDTDKTTINHRVDLKLDDRIGESKL